MQNDLQGAIDGECARLAIPQELVTALISVESGDDPSAIRFEPRYPYLWDVVREKPLRVEGAACPDVFPHFDHSTGPTEWAGQKTSWGPLQIMGAVARELGFTDKFPELCGAPGVVWGIRYLARLRERHMMRHGWEGVIRAYNTGSPLVSAAGDAYLRKVSMAGGLAFLGRGAC